MRVFVIHRTAQQADAKRFLKATHVQQNMDVEPYFIRKSYGSKWQQKAEYAIDSAEIVLVYDAEECASSPNTQWELETAKRLNKRIVHLTKMDIASRNFGPLQAEYDFASDFDSCFPKNGPAKNADRLELYKLMVSTSEDLVRRRQITNGFFITAVSGIIGATGFALTEKVLPEGAGILLIVPILIAFRMCWSWRTLLDNYGKLNAGKFKVINKLEQQLPARIFEAEWIALGKGLRKKKYQSFTSTERNVPNAFMFFLVLASVFICCTYDYSGPIQSITDLIRSIQDLLGTVQPLTFQAIEASSAD